jgi:nitroreductase
MDTLEAIRGRCSVRSFDSARGLPETVVAELVSALRWAPSAGNLESRHFTLVFDPDIRRRLAAAALGQGFVAVAPLCVVGCADRRIGGHYGRRGVELYAIQDVAASVENLLLAAHSLGLGAVWVGAFDEAAVAAVLGLPPHLRPVALVPIGYPQGPPQPSSRRPEQDTIHIVR